MPEFVVRDDETVHGCISCRLIYTAHNRVGERERDVECDTQSDACEVAAPQGREERMDAQSTIGPPTSAGTPATGCSTRTARSSGWVSFLLAALRRHGCACMQLCARVCPSVCLCLSPFWHVCSHDDGVRTLAADISCLSVFLCVCVPVCARVCHGAGVHIHLMGYGAPSWLEEEVLEMNLPSALHRVVVDPPSSCLLSV